MRRVRERSSAAPVGPVDSATFVGQAAVQRLAHDETGVPVGVYRVTFWDGARTNWHRHTGPQWLFVVEGRVRVQAEGGRPARVVTDRRELPGGRVESCAGPWRTSGQWWLHDARERRDGAREMWDRDEWDVTLADGGTYRIFRERRAGKWFVEGVVD